MKNWLLFIFSLVIVSCQQSNNHSLNPSDLTLSYGTKFDKLLLGVETQNSQLTLKDSLLLQTQDGSLLLPTGTILSKVDGDATTFTYSLPDGYKAVGQDSKGNARVAAGGSITCNCTQGKGCTPYAATLGKNQSIGCAATGNCTNCTMKLTGRSPRMAAGDVLTKVEIVNFGQDIHFVTSKAELSILVSPSHNLMQLQQVQAAIVDFAKGFQVDDLEALNKSTGPGDLPSTYSYLHVSVYGRLIMLPIQTDLVLSANPLVNELLRDDKGARARAAATVYKCKCNSGNTGCKLNSGSLLFAKAVYCEAGDCTSCTLSWI